uniref:Translation initiation factor IF2/IF5 domain-containing protein n=1 Tax=Corethron hystrix TaxID=216773 RepID=A0A7S1FNS5_9STRA|mmetsp:Transcript_19041/g.43358  ORF Transcript_19041/g.43358 Transcript_19041/m.43358 type:complete len:221 (+) Transcript_19041:307-969(+)
MRVLTKKNKPSGDGSSGDGVSLTSPDDDDDCPSRVFQRSQISSDATLAGCLADPADREASYTYSELLDRVLDSIHANNPDLAERKRRKMQPPQIQKLGTKKSLWVNFQEVCTMLRRSPEHVFAFFMAELGTEGNIDGNHRLVIRGRYQPRQIEILLRKYIVEYVTCQMCRSANTELTKDSVSRLYFCRCLNCGSNRSVGAIRSGYHATSRADRRAARNKT